MWHHLIRHVVATFHAGTRVTQPPRPPPTTPTSHASPPLPNHLRHTNTASCPSTARAHDNGRFGDVSGESGLDNAGTAGICDISGPPARGAKQLEEEGLSHVSCGCNHSGLMVITDEALIHTHTPTEGVCREFLRNPAALQFRSPPSFSLSVNSCGYLSLTHHPAG